MLRSLARACTLLTGWTIALCVSSCSLLLDWNGYTGGNAYAGDADDDRADDVAIVHDAADAIDDLDAPEELEAADQLDTSDVAILDSASPPVCGPTSCGGCCTSNGFCAGGGSAATCGTGSQPCRNCASIGQGCEHGACSSIDSGAAPMCTDAQCKSTFALCIPVYQSPCCLSDGTCGCQVQIPKGQCM